MSARRGGVQPAPGQSWADLRAQWKRDGLCRQCGAPPVPGTQYCRRHATGRKVRDKRRRETSGTPAHARRTRALVDVRIRLPLALYERVAADAAERGESIEAWIAGACLETFEAPADPEET